jgi:hypothetical protein
MKPVSIAPAAENPASQRGGYWISCEPAYPVMGPVPVRSQPLPLIWTFSPDQDFA